MTPPECSFTSIFVAREDKKSTYLFPTESGETWMSFGALQEISKDMTWNINLHTVVK